ncbi:MAG: hypothetical protein FJY15_00905 [Bacteroidetes bacterium]|nr:hypothetical protein [Bacteroidota bacterium]
MYRLTAKKLGMSKPYQAVVIFTPEEAIGRDFGFPKIQFFFFKKACNGLPSPNIFEFWDMRIRGCKINLYYQGDCRSI